MIDIIKKQLTVTYDGDPWYGPSIKTVLESIDPGCAYDSPGNGVHSIAELVAHMISWRAFTERQLRGEADHQPGQEETFDWRQFSSDKKIAWDTMRKRFGANQQQLLMLLDQRDNSLLEQIVAGKSYTFRYLLNGLIQHDIYHLGQVVYIQRVLEEQNRKRPTGGLFRYSYKIFPFENLALQK